jgi:hypothetical protein
LRTRKLNLCWVVDPWKSSREKYLRAWRDAGWPVVLWHYGQLTEAPVEGIELRDARGLVAASPIAKSFEYERSFASHAACADLLRYELLYQFGGAYSDLDVLPQGASLDMLEREQPLFEYDADALQAFEIRFIAAPPHHPLLERLRSTAAHNTEAWLATTGGYRRSQDLRDVVKRTGPRMASEVARQWARENDVPFASLTEGELLFTHTPENANEHYSEKWAVIEAELRSRSPDGKLPRRLKIPIRPWRFGFTAPR